MLKNKILSFSLFALATYLASFIGTLASIFYREPWYSLLKKPVFNPPDWIFGPIWSTLYLMMTVSVWLYWHSKNRNIKTIYIYFIHLVFNTTWSIIFFKFHNLTLALLILLALIVLIIIIIIRFRSVNLVSYYLMIPYLIWCTFALILNFKLILLN